MDMKLLIALVNYETTDLLVKCLDSIREQEIRAEYRIMVVDNHSQDGAVERLQKEYPEVTVIANTRNNGYAIAVNQAIRVANSDYILLLNPDIVVKPGAIDKLVKLMDDMSDVGIAGGKLFNPDGTLQYSCRTFFTLPVILFRRTILGKLFPNSSVLTRHLMSDWDHNSVRDVDWVLGGCMMIRRKALKDVGLMDERFFLYFEDVDWCYRMKKGGWRVCYLPDAEMIHHHRRQSAQSFVNKTLLFHIMSMFHFYDKWGKILYLLRKYRVFLAIFFFLLVDIAAINISFVGAYFIRKNLLTFLTKPQLPFFYYQNSLIFTNIIMPLLFYFLGLYTIKTGELWVDELFRVAKGVIVSTLFLMAASYLAQGYEFSRTMKVVFAGLCVLIVFLFRWFLLSWYNSLRRQGFNLRRTLIVGTGKTAGVVYKELQKHREIGFDIVGFVRDPYEQNVPGDEQVFPILGTAENIPVLIRTQNITEVIIASSSDSRELISNTKHNGVNVRLVTDLYNLSMHETTLEELAGIPMVHFKGKPLFAFNLFIKRGIDIILSSLALVFLSPLMAVIAILIKLDSSGSLIVKQKNLGKGQQKFTLYGFRSTYKWLQRFKFDHLPELFNVLRGEMSFVGPRPLPVISDMARYEGWRQRRFDIKPGITGLWQVSEQYGFSFDEMVRLDIYYIWNWSISNDLKILLRTIPAIFSQC